MYTLVGEDRGDGAWENRGKDGFRGEERTGAG